MDGRSRAESNNHVMQLAAFMRHYIEHWPYDALTWDTPAATLSRLIGKGNVQKCTTKERP